MCVCERKRERKREGENRENMTVKQGEQEGGIQSLFPQNNPNISYSEENTSKFHESLKSLLLIFMLHFPTKLRLKETF